MGSLTGARFTMYADVLRNVGGTVDDNSPAEGTWGTKQDPITGEVLNAWIPEPVTDNPQTHAVETGTRRIKCIARGVVDGGIRVAGTTQMFGGDLYENVEYVKLWVPAKEILSKNDRVTNIKLSKNGRVLWVDEEYEDGSRPTIFDVQGSTPLFDAFNKHVENYVMLRKSD